MIDIFIIVPGTVVVVEDTIVGVILVHDARLSHALYRLLLLKGTRRGRNLRVIQLARWLKLNAFFVEAH